MNSRSWFASTLASISLFSTLTIAEPWDRFSDPEKMGQGRYLYELEKLPKKGELSNEKMPWSETYFPSFKGGIAFRWQDNEPRETWKYPLYTKEQLLTLPPKKIARLSPAEKFDILMGDYSYPTVRSERDRTHFRRASWEGLCHGWAPAAIRHREPQAKTLKNLDGIEITFYSSDIKALLLYYYGRVDWKPIGWTGKRCRYGSVVDKGCRGVNPATLHLVLTNQLGRLDEAFVMDRDRASQVWNQPFYSYQSFYQGSCKVSRAGARAGAVSGLLVETKTRWIDELDYSQKHPALARREDGVLMPRYQISYYQYCLEITENQRIVGGEWAGSNRPGFIWNHERADFAHPYYGKIQELLDDGASTAPSSTHSE